MFLWLLTMVMNKQIVNIIYRLHKPSQLLDPVTNTALSFTISFGKSNAFPAILTENKLKDWFRGKFEPTQLFESSERYYCHEWWLTLFAPNNEQIGYGLHKIVFLVIHFDCYYHCVILDTSSTCLNKLYQVYCEWISLSCTSLLWIYDPAERYINIISNIYKAHFHAKSHKRYLKNIYLQYLNFFTSVKEEQVHKVISINRIPSKIGLFFRCFEKDYYHAVGLKIYV